jgi:predicted NUDIX family phosphoesterase
LLGLLKDDEVLVGQVHVGVVFEADAAGRPLSVRETDKLSGHFATPRECGPVYERMETWSQFLYDHVTGRQTGPIESG